MSDIDKLREAKLLPDDWTDDRLWTDAVRFEFLFAKLAEVSEARIEACEKGTCQIVSREDEAYDAGWQAARAAEEEKYESQLAAETARADGLYEDVVMYGRANGELKDALADETARADDLATTLQGTLTSLAAASEENDQWEVEIARVMRERNEAESSLAAATEQLQAKTAEVETLKVCGSCLHCDYGAGSGMRCYAQTPYTRTVLASACWLHPSKWLSRSPHPSQGAHQHEWRGPFKVGSQEWERRCECGASAPTHPDDANWNHPSQGGGE